MKYYVQSSKNNQKYTGDHFRLLKNARAERRRLGSEYHIYASESHGDPNLIHWYKLE